jgi:hypothetical protein
MNKLILLLALTGTAHGMLWAQPTLQMNVVGQIGDIVTFQVADTLNISQGNAGANQTWNFSNLKPESDLGTTKSVNYLSNLTSSAFGGPDQLQGLSINLAGANPVADQLALNITASEGRENLQMLVTNAGGHVVASRALTVLPGESRMDLPIEHLPAGAYFLTVTDGRGASTLKWQKL